jgi:putative ABC transport system permease protein
MPTPISQNRQMFWRITRRMLSAHRGRLFVVLLALGAGAAVTAALLNLEVDAKHRLSTEFRSFGPNVVIAPEQAGDALGFLSESLFDRIPDRTTFGPIAKAEFLYGVVDVSALQLGQERPEPASPTTRAVLVGYAHSDPGAKQVIPPSVVEAEDKRKFISSLRCTVGAKVASTLKLGARDGVWLKNESRTFSIGADVLPKSGGPEDNQVFVDLVVAQKLLQKQGQISVVQLNLPGTSEQIDQFVQQLQRKLGDAEVRPIRQFTEAQTTIYGRISGLLTATVVVVLALTSLCVMAAMTNVAMERKNDVGLMKAIGGATRRVLRLFLAEAALLGLAGGLLGAAAGILLSIWLGKQVFGVAAEPRLIVYPVAVLLTVIVAIFSAFPLRRLATVRPASVFRGEA